MINKVSKSRDLLERFPDTGKVSLELLLNFVQQNDNASIRELGRYYIGYAQTIEHERCRLMLLRIRSRLSNQKKL